MQGQQNVEKENNVMSHNEGLRCLKKLIGGGGSWRKSRDDGLRDLYSSVDAVRVMYDGISKTRDIWVRNCVIV